MSIAPGSRVGPYEIESQIGSGGMGEVWRATDTRVDRAVALKVLPESLFDDATRRARFEREAKLLASLNHPGIATLYSFEEVSGRHLLAMELVEGNGLDQRIGSGPLPLSEILSLATQIAEALDAAHEKGVIHRDLKPANIMLSASGRVKLLDFGLAKKLEEARMQNDETSPQVTQDGGLMGTFPYMSPEQVSGRPLDRRTDLFSFGIILYEMAAGQRPFQGDSIAELISAILRDPPLPVTRFRRDLPSEVANFVHRCLHKDPQQRPEAARELVTIIESLRSGERAPVAVASAVSIAVLPFADMSPGKDQEYLCEGMAEEIMSALASIDGIRVASRTSAFRASRQNDDLATLARALNVNQVLEGSIRTAAGRIRVTARLMDPGTDAQLWSARYDREAGDIFAIQDEIAAGVVDAVAQRLSARQPAIHLRSHVRNLEAYHLYLKGRHLRYTKNDPLGALNAFEQAVAGDPLHGPSWVSLAEGNLICASYGLKPSAEALPAAKEALATAGNLQGETGMARYVEAGIAFVQRRWKDAERAMFRSIAVDPNDVTARCWLGMYLATRGRIEEALPHFDHAREIDPLAPYPYCVTALGLLQARRFEEAERFVEQALAFDDTNSLALWISGSALVALQRFDLAISRLEHADQSAGGRNAFIHAALGWALAAAGRNEDALQILAELQARPASAGHAVSEVWLAAAVGAHDLAFQILDRVARDTSLFLPYTGLPGLDPLRSDPRFIAFMERMDQSVSKEKRTL